jgi:hypothetical protein
MRHAVAQGLTLALLLEIVKVPIHSRPASATGVVVSGLGVLVVAFGASMLIRWLAILDRAVVWCVGSLGWTALMLIGFLGRFDSIERDPAILEQRLQGIEHTRHRNSRPAKTFWSSWLFLEHSRFYCADGARDCERKRSCVSRRRGLS